MGSTASKCVILKNGKEIVGKSLIGVGIGTSGPDRAISQVLNEVGMTREDMACVLATGYGRNMLMDFAPLGNKCQRVGHQYTPSDYLTHIGVHKYFLNEYMNLVSITKTKLV